MDLRRLTGPAPQNRPFGRRATDAGAARTHSAAFVAQVAGLSLPEDAAAAAYPTGESRPPAGLVTDARA